MNLPFELAKGVELWKSTQDICNAGLDGEAIKSLFRYGRVRSATLYLVFVHPGGKYEFGRKKEVITQRMREYYRLHAKRLKERGVVFSKIEAICIIPLRSGVIVTEVKKERENAKGNFENRAKNPALFAVFEEIRKEIKKQF